jgi:DNA-binding NarL/FixJ family response regulator
LLINHVDHRAVIRVEVSQEVNAPSPTKSCGVAFTHMQAAYQTGRAAATRDNTVDRLSRREQQIVEALLTGCTNKEIARRLGVSDQTIKNQLTTLYRKLGMGGRLELVLWAIERHKIQDTRD